MIWSIGRTKLCWSFQMAKAYELVTSSQATSWSPFFSGVCSRFSPLLLSSIGTDHIPYVFALPPRPSVPFCDRELAATVLCCVQSHFPRKKKIVFIQSHDRHWTYKWLLMCVWIEWPVTFTKRTYYYMVCVGMLWRMKLYWQHVRKVALHSSRRWKRSNITRECNTRLWVQI